MPAMTIFTCLLRQVPRDKAHHPDHFELVKEFANGNDEVVWQGSFHECRSMMDNLYRHYVRNSSHFSVYWRDEFSLLVYQLPQESVAADSVRGLGV